jgi:hypothetical protein
MSDYLIKSPRKRIEVAQAPRWRPNIREALKPL